MSPNERVIILQRQVELMQARMERMRSQRDSFIDFITDLSETLKQHDHEGTVTVLIEQKVKELRAQLGQDEIL